MQYSFWEKNTFLQNADLIIIGSGIVGLNAALTAKEHDKSLRIVVLERGFLPAGASTRNAGFACFGSMTELLDDLETQSEADVFALVERRFRGLQRLRERVSDAEMQYEELGGFEVFRPNDKLILEKCVDNIDNFNQKLYSILNLKNIYKIDNQIITKNNFNNISNCIKNNAEGQIDTGKMMRALLRQCYVADIQILNGINVENWTEHADQITIHAKQFTTFLKQSHADQNFDISASQVLICTNGFTKRLLPELDVEPARNQVLITKPIVGLKLRGCFHYDCGYYYFRNVGDSRILLGGGRNLAKNAEATDEFGTTDLIKNALTDLLKNVILPNNPNAQIDYWWSGILGIGAVKRPIVERISPRLSVAVRMGGMGVAIGALVGEEGAILSLGN